MRLPGRRAGKTLGMYIDQTWAHLFEENERRYEARSDGRRVSRPRTDSELTAFMKAEFPLTRDQRAWLKERGAKYTAFEYPTGKRSRYNCGLLSGMKKRKPEKKSYRYDEEGQRMDGYVPRDKE